MSNTIPRIEYDTPATTVEELDRRILERGPHGYEATDDEIDMFWEHNIAEADEYVASLDKANEE